LIGIVLGSAASITFGLGAVLVVFWVLMGEHPDLSREMPQLAGSLVAFAILTTASAGVSSAGHLEAVAWLGASRYRYFPMHRGFVVLAAPHLTGRVSSYATS